MLQSLTAIDLGGGRIADVSFNSVAELSDQQIAVLVRGTREEARLADALAPIQVKKAELAGIVHEVEIRHTEAGRIAEDQQRLREHVGALKGGGEPQQLVKRDVAQLTQQEDQLAALRAENADLDRRRARALEELGALIQQLTLVLEAGNDNHAPPQELPRGKEAALRPSPSAAAGAAPTAIG